MDNYERFQELVSGAGQSDGYLQNQAEIYAQSWEGAKNRLTAAWQGIYDQLIDDKFFIKLTNFLIGIVNTLGQIIQGAGGVKGVISMITLGLTSLDPAAFAQKIRDLGESILLLKDALSGAQESANISFKGSFLDLLFTQNEVTDNPKIMQLLDDEVAMLEKINILEADGNTQEAALLKAKLDRHAQELQALIANEQELQKTKLLLQEIADISDYPDKDLYRLQKTSIQTAQWSSFAKDVQQFKGLNTEDERFDLALQLNQRYRGDGANNILSRIVFDGMTVDEAVAEAEANAEKGVKQIIQDLQSYAKEFTANGGDKEGLKKLLGIDDDTITITNEQLSELQDKVIGLQQAKATAQNEQGIASPEEVAQLNEQEQIINNLIDRLLKYGQLTNDQRLALERLRQESNEVNNSFD